MRNTSISIIIGISIVLCIGVIHLPENDLIAAPLSFDFIVDASDAGTRARGGAGIGVSENILMTPINPASIGWLKSPEIAINYGTGIAGMKITRAAIGIPTKSIMAACTFSMWNMPSEPETDYNGITGFAMQYSVMAVDLTVMRWAQRIPVGVTAHFIRETLPEGFSIFTTFDAGVQDMYIINEFGIIESIFWGAALRHIGPNVRRGLRREQPPMSIGGGGGITINVNGVVCMLPMIDIEYRLHNKTIIRPGLQCDINEWLSLRIGRRIDRSTMEVISCGLGIHRLIKKRSVQFDYAVSFLRDDLEARHTIQLSCDISRR